MKNRELERQRQSVDALFRRTSEACGGDIEIMSHWARYLCVLCAGFLERSLVTVYSDYCRATASAPVASFAVKSLELFQNPKTSRFLEVAGRFRSDWRDDLDAFVSEGGRREAIDSIMANRHLIAHGQRSDVTVARVADYFTKAVSVVEFIEGQCE